MNKRSNKQSNKLEKVTSTGVRIQLEKEYSRIIKVLSQTGILTLLPKSKESGVIGIDGKEYPVPTQEHLQKVFSNNKELVDLKMQQGFTKLQLTPLAIPIPQLIELVKASILKHNKDGKIFQTKQNSDNNDIPVSVGISKSIWIWDKVRKVFDTDDIVYFPHTYSDLINKGLTKEEVIQNKSLCAIPGWSIGLIEPANILHLGQDKISKERKHLEVDSNPRNYLQILNTATYQGETGWTLEDFLTNFIIQLETTNQVSYDRSNGNALWLLGSYIPNLGFGLCNLVMVGYWSRIRRGMDITAHRSGNNLTCWVAQTMVRLSI
jgi:hypothetical protein